MQFTLHRINLFMNPYARPDECATRISATIAIAMVIGTVTGCGNDSAGGRYPPDWPKLERVATNGKSCPDITGNYTFENDVDDSAFGSDSTFIGRNVTRDAKWPWQSVAISGDASISLTLTYSRPRPALSGVPMSPDTTKTTLVHGTHYTCDNGWLITPKADLSIRTVSQNAVHRDVQYRGARRVADSAVHFRRDTNGGLVARVEVREYRVLSVWAETGAGIPYWSDARTYWAHWPSARMLSATVLAGKATRAEIAQMSRLEREVYERENDAGTSMSDAEFRALVRRMVDAGAKFESMRSEMRGYSISIRVSARGQVTRTLENFRESDAFTNVRDHGSVTSTGQTEIATISFERRN